MGDLIISFDHYKYIPFEKLDERNLSYCKFLNLRKSGIKTLRTKYLFEVILIDISDNDYLLEIYLWCC